MCTLLVITSGGAALAENVQCPERPNENDFVLPGNAIIMRTELTCLLWQLSTLGLSNRDVDLYIGNETLGVSGFHEYSNYRDIELFVRQSVANHLNANPTLLRRNEYFDDIYELSVPIYVVIEGMELDGITGRGSYMFDTSNAAIISNNPELPIPAPNAFHLPGAQKRGINLRNALVKFGFSSANKHKLDEYLTIAESFNKKYGQYSEERVQIADKFFTHDKFYTKQDVSVKVQAFRDEKTTVFIIDYSLSERGRHRILDAIHTLYNARIKGAEEKLKFNY
jgi:hypothetical protein